MLSQNTLNTRRDYSFELSVAINLQRREEQLGFSGVSVTCYCVDGEKK